MAEDEALADRGEHPFLRQLVDRLRSRETADGSRHGAELLVGNGDDAAVFSPGSHSFAVTTDALIEGTHFRAGWLDASQLGRRAVEVNLSDLAAMAAQPRFLLAAVGVPADTPTRWLDELLDACAHASQDAGASLIGGNLTCASTVTITVTAIGEIPGRRLERRGARPGDDLVVTGTLGDAAAAVAAWQAGGEPEQEQWQRWACPRARIAAGLALAEAGAHAAIDLSDGLLADLGHLCVASDVGAEVERNRLPRTPRIAQLDTDGNDFAATGGENYELLAACPPSLRSELAALGARAQVELTVIGHCTEQKGQVSLLDENQQPLAVGAGFDHFSASTGEG